MRHEGQHPNGQSVVEHEKWKRATWDYEDGYEYKGCPACLNEEPQIQALIGFYAMWKRFGLPFAPLGWASHPAWMIYVITLLSKEESR
jgi:hypothetical protein